MQIKIVSRVNCTGKSEARYAIPQAESQKIP
jgi:hypothetical protein